MILKCLHIVIELVLSIKTNRSNLWEKFAKQCTVVFSSIMAALITVSKTTKKENEPLEMGESTLKTRKSAAEDLPTHPHDLQKFHK